jgi:hypothetical protein
LVGEWQPAQVLSPFRPVTSTKAVGRRWRGADRRASGAAPRAWIRCGREARLT